MVELRKLEAMMLALIRHRLGWCLMALMVLTSGCANAGEATGATPAKERAKRATLFSGYYKDGSPRRAVAF